MIRNPTRFGLIAATFLALTGARGVVLLGDGNPATNTTAPTGDLAGSGWQYEGGFGGFLGTPIAPEFFMTAKHVSGASSVFNYLGTNYDLLQRYSDPFSDLSIWQVNGTFPSFAPLYTSGAEAGQPLVVMGRGTQRGAAVSRGGTLRGWAWGTGDGVERWGQNIVSDIVADGTLNQYVYATFDQEGGPNEAHLSSGDSGGAVFIRDGLVWKLAGINYAVDGPFFSDASGGGGFDGALFDARDFYYQDGYNPPHFSLITGKRPVPSGFYASRIASKLGWIYSVIDPNGDVDGNGISNLTDYAHSLNLAGPIGPGAPIVAREGSALTITYRRLVRANAPASIIEKSNDLRMWAAATPTETILRVDEDVQTVKASVPVSGTRLFLRVRTGP
ncbi:MAG: hypothetical protein ACR2ID_01495 [Chthoniobacterales bacterium]